MIEIENIKKSFNDKEILKGISGIFEKGKTNLIIGASGTGKSVLLKNIVGLVHPDEGIDLKLNTKHPGVSGFDLEELPLDLNLHEYHEIGHQDCYERLLLDVIKGNPSLFVRRDEIEASWKWIDNIINLWESEDVPMEEYISGGWGPSNADLLLKREFRAWKNGSKKK